MISSGNLSLTSAYAEHAPKAELEEVLESQSVFSLRMTQPARQRQALQGLKRRFYEHCEQHYSQIELSAGQVNAFLRVSRCLQRQMKQRFLKCA